MAFKPAEAWINSNQTIVAVKKKGGGYQYYVTVVGLNIGEVPIANIPAVSAEISNTALEIMEAKDL